MCTLSALNKELEGKKTEEGGGWEAEGNSSPSQASSCWREGGQWKERETGAKVERLGGGGRQR